MALWEIAHRHIWKLKAHLKILEVDWMNLLSVTSQRGQSDSQTTTGARW